MDRIEAIGAFVAVVDRGGFAPAARALGHSPSAVTRMVAGLEGRLGVRLLQRTTRAVHLTDPGARFLERARRILVDLDEAERLAGSAQAAPAGLLGIAAPVMFGRLHVAPLVGDYLARYPAVTAELRLNDRWAALVEEGLDVAVRIGRLADSSLVTRRVGATRRVVVAAPAYLAAAGTPETPADLLRHRVISGTGIGPADRWRFQSEGRLAEAAVAPAFRTNSVDAALAQAERGGGLTQALSYQVAERVRAGTLALVLVPFEPEPLPIQFVYPSARLLPISVRALIDLAVATCNWDFLTL